MIDPEAAKNAALVGAGAYLAKDLLKQALGPTADYIGEGLKQFTAKRIENINRIFRKFINKLGERIDEPGQVHPKLLKNLILDGSFCDDELTAEYYGGVLASSRTGVNRDDRGITYLDQVSRLSTYQIRTHFIIYTVIRDLFKGVKIAPHQKLRTGVHPHIYSICIPQSDYNIAMDFGDKEDINLCTHHSLTGLDNNGLAEIINYKPQALKGVTGNYKNNESGFSIRPTIAGVELFLWASGHGDVDIADFLTLDIEVPKDIVIPAKASILHKSFLLK
jgi:hypothetical protein